MSRNDWLENKIIFLTIDKNEWKGDMTYTHREIQDALNLLWHRIYCC